jgi:polyisoprenyl-teichoic acid--peptidoglycan teichoic acid transferase
MSKLKRRFYKHLWLTRPLTYFGVASIIVVLIIFLIPKLVPLFKNLAKGPSTVISAINPSIQNLDSFKNRTNILLLGTGGGNHPGADLTDSIMLISINIYTSDTVLISLPRDIWVESLSAKLNTAYHFGEEKLTGGGLTLAKSAVSEITNQPIHYGVMLDFSGFEKAIDVVGGVDLNVPRGFIDKQYPVPGQEEAEPETDRYEVLEFFSGDQHMDGSTALKYVRSRHAEGEEGTDYSRAERQQRVILAFKEKILSGATLLKPKKIQALKQIVIDSVKTDLPSSTYPDLLKLALRLDQTNIRTGIIDQGSWSEDIPPLLYNPPISLHGQWTLLPINNDWQSVYTHIENILYQ